LSYILEALKKSQEERELGQVPTLVAAPVSEPRRSARGGTWGLVATGLAALAVGIALYAALSRVEVPSAATRPDPSIALAPPITQEPSGPASAPQLAPPPAAAAGRTEAIPGPPFGAVPPGPAPTDYQPPPETARPPGDARPLPAATRQAAVPSRTLEPLDDEGLSNPAQPVGTDEADEAAGAEDAMDEPISGDWMEMDEEIGPARPAERPPPGPRERPQRISSARPAIPEPKVEPIPEDLRKDVAAFKDELLRERSGAPPRPAKAVAEDPRKLRLPLEVEGRLPAFFVTVQVYDKAQEKRFVVINSLKYIQGEKTREGLMVEEILPDGVVLSFEGNRFFRRR